MAILVKACVQVGCSTVYVMLSFSEISSTCNSQNHAHTQPCELWEVSDAGLTVAAAALMGLPLLTWSQSRLG